MFSQVQAPGSFNYESASRARELEQEGTGTGLPLGGLEQDAAKNVLEKWASNLGAGREQGAGLPFRGKDIHSAAQQDGFAFWSAGAHCTTIRCSPFVSGLGDPEAEGPKQLQFPACDFAQANLFSESFCL